MKSGVEDNLPTRYSLLSRLQDWEDNASWKEFFDLYWRLIYSVAIKSGLSDAEAQDVVQETLLCVARDLDTFKKTPERGSFKGWLFNVVRWRILDEKQRRTSAPEPVHSPTERGSSTEESVVGDPEWSTLWEQEWKNNLFETALGRVKRRVKEEQFQVFDLFVLKQWPAAKVSRLLGVSRPQIYITKHRLSQLLKREIKALEERDV